MPREFLIIPLAVLLIALAFFVPQYTFPGIGTMTWHEYFILKAMKANPATCERVRVQDESLAKMREILARRNEELPHACWKCSTVRQDDPAETGAIAATLCYRKI
jgi:hypothetical protein